MGATVHGQLIADISDLEPAEIISWDEQGTPKDGLPFIPDSRRNRLAEEDGSGLRAIIDEVLLDTAGAHRYGECPVRSWYLQA